MKPPTSSEPESDPVGRAAAEWMLRHDRGLTAAEQDAFSHWLAADPRHRAAWAEHRWGWDELDRLAGLQTSVEALPDPDLLAPGRGGRRRSLVPSLSLAILAVAAAVVLGVFLRQPPAEPVTASSPGASPPLALIERRELADGSVVELNRGAIVHERFTPATRRVVLTRGEAHFTVTKDAARPFVVEVGGMAVRAVGTAFNVRLDTAAVEVLVTEGTVSVAPDVAAADGATGESGAPLVAAGQRTVVPLAAVAAVPAAQALSPGEIEARLAWQSRLLEFTNAPLADVVAEFNRRNPVRLTLGDESLRPLRLSVTFRSDNVEGFVRLMASDFGMRVERRGASEIVLTALAAPKPR